MKIYISKLLGMAILAGSFALKLPQIYNIVSTGNVEGLAPMSFYSEVPLFAASAIYNYRQGNEITTYGESVIILVQNIILVLMLWQYTKPSPSIGTMIGVSTCLSGAIAAMFIVPQEYLFVLPLLNLPLTLASRVPQIITNFKLKSTGQLSLITLTLNFGGSLARVFTTITQVGWDMNLLSGFALGLATSGALLFQVIFYSFIAPEKNVDKKQKETKKTK